MKENMKTKIVKIKELTGKETLANGDDVMYTVWKGSKKLVKTVGPNGVGGFTLSACAKIEIIVKE